MRKLTKQQISNRRKWIEALRSGKYKQGKHRLHYRGRYCCLGVAEAEGLAVSIDAEENLILCYIDAGRSLGLYSGDGALDPADDQYLSDLNDSGDWSFSEIADLIELDTEVRR